MLGHGMPTNAACKRTQRDVNRPPARDRTRKPARKPAGWSARKAVPFAHPDVRQGGPRQGDSRSALAEEQAGGAGGDLHDVYFRLRQAILNGAIPPGEVVNQVHVARQFKVSRTPVREALRMLQAEGLVDAQFQHRMRVTAVSADEVDTVYAMWIMLSALAISLTVPRISRDELAQLRRALAAMNASSPRRTGSQAEWEPLHQEFHRLLVSRAGPVLGAAIDTCWARSERARRAYMRSSPQSWQESETEHRDMVEAYAEGSVPRAIYVISRQLTRIALTVIGSIDPAHEPRAIREALALATRPDGQVLASALGGVLTAGARAPSMAGGTARPGRAAKSAR